MLRTEGSQEPRGRASLGHTTWRDREAELLQQTVRKGDEMAMFFPIGGHSPGMKENTFSLDTHTQRKFNVQLGVTWFKDNVVSPYLKGSARSIQIGKNTR